MFRIFHGKKHLWLSSTFVPSSLLVEKQSPIFGLKGLSPPFSPFFCWKEEKCGCSDFEVKRAKPAESGAVFSLGFLNGDGSAEECPSVGQHSIAHEAVKSSRWEGGRKNAARRFPAFSFFAEENLKYFRAGNRGSVFRPMIPTLFCAASIFTCLKVHLCNSARFPLLSPDE